MSNYILACGQCWLGAAQAMSFVILFGGSTFHYLKSLRRRD